ncbi:MAG TPA: hypothetical protein VJT09_01115 [Pyrinomonadaceae bacterium]|nr:hypothetical protein [Pyrinomonadaceae bacterium]
MKRCPTCGLSLDDSQAFCTNDGTPLVADKSYDPQATMIIPPASVPTAQPPETRPQGQQSGWQPPARQTSPVYAAQPGAYNQQSQAARPGRFVPGLIGGAVAGILSLIAGFLPPDAFVIFSFFCVLWAVIGGAVASNLYIKRSPTPVRTGEGAVMGLIAGAIGALLYLALATPVAYAMHADYIQMVANQQPEKISAGAFFALSGLAGAVTILGFSVIGGLIGVPMFEKRKGYHTSVPPPPPGYGTPPGGYR